MNGGGGSNAFTGSDNYFAIFSQSGATITNSIVSQSGTAGIEIDGYIEASSSGDSFFIGGNVGIGIEFPTETLHVSGNISASGYLELSASGDSYFIGGNVGIGTETPDKLLTVAGDISSSGDIYILDNKLLYGTAS